MLGGTACRLLVDCLSTACRLLVDCLSTACRLLVDCLSTACRGSLVVFGQRESLSRGKRGQVFNEKAEVSAQREGCKKMIGVLSKAMTVGACS